MFVLLLLLVTPCLAKLRIFWSRPGLKFDKMSSNLLFSLPLASLAVVGVAGGEGDVSTLCVAGGSAPMTGQPSGAKSVDESGLPAPFSKLRSI